MPEPHLFPALLFALSRTAPWVKEIDSGRHELSSIPPALGRHTLEDLEEWLDA